MKIGLETPNFAEVLSGVQEGELVVTGSRAGLRAGNSRGAEDRRRLRASRRTTNVAGFSIRNPYLIVVLCLVLTVVGVTAVVRMPVDLFPPIRIPVVVVATFYSGMPPEQIEADITGTV